MRGADIDTTMLVMIGAMIVMQNSEQLIWGGVAKSVPTPFPETPLVIGPVSVSYLRVFVLAMALLLIAATYVLINRTKLGKAMRATFQDRDTASLMGVNVQAIYTATFAIGSGTSGCRRRIARAGLCDLPAYGRSRFAQSVRHRHPGRPWQHHGATIGGFVLALAEELGAGYVSSGYRDAMGFLIIIAVLLVNPPACSLARSALGEASPSAHSRGAACVGSGYG